MLIVIIIILLLVLISFTKVNVYIDFYHGQDNDHLIIQFKAWAGLIKYKINVPMIKVDDDSPSVVVKEKVEQGPKEIDKKKETKKFTAEELFKTLKDTKELLEHVVGLHRIIRGFLRKTYIKQLEWHTIVGIGDAAHTGMIGGAVWTVKGSIVGLLSNYMRLKTMPTITVTPHFQMAISQISFKCMFHFRIGHAIFAGIKLVKFWKGGLPHFRTKPLSVLSEDKTKSV